MVLSQGLCLSTVHVSDAIRFLSLDKQQVKRKAGDIPPWALFLRLGHATHAEDEVIRVVDDGPEERMIRHDDRIHAHAPQRGHRRRRGHLGTRLGDLHERLVEDVRDGCGAVGHPGEVGILAERGRHAEVPEGDAQRDRIAGIDGEPGHAERDLLPPELRPQRSQLVRRQAELDCLQTGVRARDDDDHRHVAPLIGDLDDVGVVRLGVAELVLDPHHVAWAELSATGLELRRVRLALVERLRPRRQQIQGVDQDHLGIGTDTPWSQKVLDPLLRLLLHPVIDDVPGVLRVGEVDALGGSVIPIPQDLEELVPDADVRVVEDAVGERELDTVGRGPADDAGHHGRILRRRGLGRDVQVENLGHLLRRDAPGTGPGHGQRRRDAGRRDREVVAITARQHLVDVEAKGVARVRDHGHCRILPLESAQRSEGSHSLLLFGLSQENNDLTVFLRLYFY